MSRLFRAFYVATFKSTILKMATSRAWQILHRVTQASVAPLFYVPSASPCQEA